MNRIDYVIEYEFAAMALLTVLIGLYHTRGKFRTAANAVFSALMGMNLASSVLHTITITMRSNAENYPLWLNYAVNIAYWFVYVIIAPLSLVFVSEVLHNGSRHKKEIIIAMSAVIVKAVLLFTTPFTKWIIYFDENMNHHHGPLFNIIPAIALLILIYEFILFIRFKKQLKPKQLTSMVLFTVFTVSAAIIQFIFPHQVVGNFMIAISTLIFYISIENPSDYISNMMGCANAEAFFITAEYLLNKGKSFSVAAYCPQGLDYITELLGARESGKICYEIIQRLKKRLGKSEIFYLLNWEFVIISKEYEPSELAEILTDFFKEPINTSGIDALVRPYICTVKCPGFITSVKDLRDAIDHTIKSMRGSKDMLAEITPESVNSKQRELKVLAAIRRAIKNDSFEMYYQPLYNIKTGCFTSAEALIRMNDEELGFVSPDEFIPLAEANGLIMEIGVMSFRAVCRFLKSGRAQQYGLKCIEVNLSVVQCAQQKLGEQLIGIMDEFGIAPEQINFEITETAGLANYDMLLTNMNNLISWGVSFSMDDFGTGFSTANYLISLPMEIVKIDKSILWPAMENKEAFTILRHMVKMLRSLNKKIVVEGVETAAMVKLLSDIGCDYLQGYYFSKPVPADDFVDFLSVNDEYSA